MKMVHTAAFGEILLRFSPPGRQLLLQTPGLDVWVGGAEANVVTALARLGGQTSMISALPSNALGDAALGELRRHGVDCHHVWRRPGRMGATMSSAAPASGRQMSSTTATIRRS
jgi:2-dehydro-3-deoxygluconokinase